LVRDALRDYVLDEIVLACMAIDVIRNINENKYLVVKEEVYNGDIEYVTASIDLAYEPWKPDTYLNCYGREGWKVVSVELDGTVRKYLLMRRTGMQADGRF